MQQASTTPGPSLQKKSEFSRKLPAINNILKENSINMFKRTLLFYSLSTCIYKVSRASKSSPQFSRATEQAKKSWREREKKISSHEKDFGHLLAWRERGRRRKQLEILICPRRRGEAKKKKSLLNFALGKEEGGGKSVSCLGASSSAGAFLK